MFKLNELLFFTFQTGYKMLEGFSPFGCDLWHWTIFNYVDSGLELSR